MSHDLVRSSPEAQGICSAAIGRFVNAVEQQVRDLHSFMLLRHGTVVAEGWWEPYARNELHLLFSLSKSFTSTAVGLAVGEGRLCVDDAVVSHFAEECPREISPNLAAMRVRHLLSMSTGHHEDATDVTVGAPDGNWVRAFLAKPVQHEPGSHFAYNSAATYMLSALVQKLTGLTLLDYLTPRLLSPLGIEHVTWEKCPRGICTGGWGLSARTEDIARFGQLYLQRGRWNGRQLLAEAWVDEATRKQVSNGSDANSDWNQGYGYQFWRCRHGAYRGDGAFGQFCIVMPGEDAVLAMTGGVNDMGEVLNLVWEHLLPAMEMAALPPDASGCRDLQQKLATLRVAGLSGVPCSPIAPQITGKTYTFEPNDQHLSKARLEFSGDRSRMILTHAGSEDVVEFGHSEWIRGTSLFRGHAMHPTPSPIPAAGCYAWTAPDTWTGKLRFYQTPGSQIVTCRFEADRMMMTIQQSHCFGQKEWPTVTARLEA